jgi:hypothetical protein
MGQRCDENKDTTSPDPDNPKNPKPSLKKNSFYKES